MRKNPNPQQSGSPQPDGTPPRRSAFYVILGLALLFLAVTLLVSLVRKCRQSGVSLTVIVSALGFLLFCIVGFMLLNGEIRHICKKIAAWRRQNGRSHGRKQL